jgi:hypothetical protein
LIKKFKELFKEEGASIKILDRVTLMTPENIHVNSFMYEPIVDMSDEHLKKLYSDAKTLSWWLGVILSTRNNSFEGPLKILFTGGRRHHRDNHHRSIAPADVVHGAFGFDRGAAIVFGLFGTDLAPPAIARSRAALLAAARLSGDHGVYWKSGWPIGLMPRAFSDSGQYQSDEPRSSAIARVLASTVVNAGPPVLRSMAPLLLLRRGDTSRLYKVCKDGAVNDQTLPVVFGEAQRGPTEFQIDTTCRFVRQVEAVIADFNRSVINQSITIPTFFSWHDESDWF